jgi:hypothetical protein
MSTEAKERIRLDQIKRWAAAKKSIKPAKPSLNATVAPVPATKKGITKSKA